MTPNLNKKISKTNGKWVFCKHKERETYELDVPFNTTTINRRSKKQKLYLKFNFL